MKYVDVRGCGPACTFVNQVPCLAEIRMLY